MLVGKLSIKGYVMTSDSFDEQIDEIGWKVNI